jgi:hypothetical protein
MRRHASNRPRFFCPPVAALGVSPTPPKTTPQVEVRKYSAGAAAGAPPPPGAVVRACVARLPPSYERVEIEGLPDDQLWGLDGFDT